MGHAVDVCTKVLMGVAVRRRTQAAGTKIACINLSPANVATWCAADQHLLLSLKYRHFCQKIFFSARRILVRKV